MRERFKAKKPRSWMLRFHTQTAGCSLTAQQPYNNIVRTAYEALAAVLGGTQSLHTNSLDETYAIPTEEAVTIALRTQQVLAEETGVVNTIDPLGRILFRGSPHRTRSRIRPGNISGRSTRWEEWWQRLNEVIPSPRSLMPPTSFRNRSIPGRRSIVGVNKYVTDHPPITIWRMRPEIEQRQLKRLQEVKRNRNNDRVKECLEQIREASLGDENLMPFIIDAVREYATIQEICDVWREVFGRYTDPGYF